MKHFYSPETGELINTQDKADWMGETALTPPVFDISTQGCFFIDGAWQIVTSQPIIPIPAAVNMRQARLALLSAGLLASVNTAIASIAGAPGDAARIEWEFAQEVRRDSALVQSLIPSLGLTNTQIDNLFVLAETL